MSTASEIREKILSFETNVNKFEIIVTGDENAEVFTENGPVPSVSKFYKDVKETIVDPFTSEVVEARNEIRISRTEISDAKNEVNENLISVTTKASEVDQAAFQASQDALQVGQHLLVTLQNVTTTSDNASRAELAADLAEDAVQYTYLVDDEVGLNALVGMVIDDRAYVRATEHVWRYDGTVWADLGSSPNASKAPLLSPAFVGIPTAPTADDADPDQVANVTYVAEKLSGKAPASVFQPNATLPGEEEVALFVADLVSVALKLLTDGTLVVPKMRVAGAQQQYVVAPGYARVWHDLAGRIVLGLRENGVLESTASLVAGALFKEVIAPGYAKVWYDEFGNISGGWTDDGAFKVSTLRVQNLEYSGSLGANRNGARLTHQLNMIIGYGQSLGEGSTPAVALTTAQEYDLVGFPARSVSPVSFVPLTVENTQWSSRGESPIYGTLGRIKELINDENNLPFGQDDYLLIGVNDAVSGSTTAELQKGTTFYDIVMSQVDAGLAIAISQGKSFAVQAITYTQGEAETDPVVYKAALKQLATDFNNDIRQKTLQTVPVRFIIYQTATRTMDLAMAQFEAANEHPLIIQACPMYQFEYGDSLHITSDASKDLGGYYGLVYKRVVVDNRNYDPLYPVGHAVNGSVVDLIFNHTGLVLDTTTLPEISNFGFSVSEGTIVSVTLVGSNRVRLTLDAPPAPDTVISYGASSAGVGRSDAFVGLAGNLRDSAGDWLSYRGKRSDGWSMLFRYVI